MKLYSYSGSANGYKIDLLLAQLAKKHERIEVEIFRGEARTPELLAKNPAGRIPILEDDDGTVIFESNAILCHLAHGTKLASDDRRIATRILTWMFFEQNEIEPTIGSARFWKLTSRDVDRRDEFERRKARGREMLGVVERALRSQPFLAGDHYSIADIALYAYGHLAGDIGIELAEYSAVSRWCKTIERQDRFFAGPGPYTAAAKIRS